MGLQFSFLSVLKTEDYRVGTYVSGHPDEYDARELIEADPHLKEMVDAIGDTTVIGVDHYDFDTRYGKDELAENSHFAIIHAYDEMVLGTNLCQFADRDDVEHTDSFTFPWKEEEE